MNIMVGVVAVISNYVNRCPIYFIWFVWCGVQAKKEVLTSWRLLLPNSKPPPPKFSKISTLPFLSFNFRMCI